MTPPEHASQKPASDPKAGAGASNTPEAEPQEAQAETARLEQELKQALAERDVNLEKWQRTAAEFDNYRKRSLKEQEQDQRYRYLPIARDLLPVLDNLNRALQAAKGTHDVDQLLQGVEMVVQQFKDVLGRQSIVPIEAAGQPFDPNLHEAIQQFPSADHPPMTVLQEVEPGFMLHDRVVRPTKVIVSSAPPEGS